MMNQGSLSIISHQSAPSSKIVLDLMREITLISLLKKVSCGEIPAHLTLQGLSSPEEKLIAY